MVISGLRGLRAPLLLVLLCGQMVILPQLARAMEAKVEPTLPISISLNMVQGEQGVSIAPTLRSERAMAITFTLMVQSDGVAGHSRQQQSRNLSLQAGEVREAGKIGLGLRCPYRVEVTAQIWQNEQLLVEKKELMDCPT